MCLPPVPHSQRQLRAHFSFRSLGFHVYDLVLQRERRTVLLERLREIDLGDPKDGDLGRALAQSTVSTLLRHAVT